MTDWRASQKGWKNETPDPSKSRDAVDQTKQTWKKRANILACQPENVNITSRSCPCVLLLFPHPSGVWGNVSFWEPSVSITNVHAHARVLRRFRWMFFKGKCCVTFLAQALHSHILAWALSDTANFRSQTNTSLQTSTSGDGKRTGSENTWKIPAGCGLKCHVVLFYFFFCLMWVC